MLRRFGQSTLRSTASGLPLLGASRSWYSNGTAELGRQDTTKTLSKVGEEYKGQSLDLQDMCNASRAALKECTDLSVRLGKTDADENLKNKVSSMVSRLKAYSMRISTVQAEAHSLHADMEAIVKRAYRPEGDATEQMDAPPVEETTTTARTIEVETPKASEAEVICETEIVVEAPEVNETATSGSNDATSPDPYATMSITEITEYLHDNGIDFGDCFDAASLRKRFREVKAGTYVDLRKKQKLEEIEAKRRQEQQQHQQWTPPPPPPPQYNQPPPTNYAGGNQQSGQNMNYGGNQSQGLVADPYPGAERRMVDPMKFVWEIKKEFGQAKNIDPARVDLWCGPTKLDDHRRLYEYPQLQQSPIEMRMKGDTPQNAYR